MKIALVFNESTIPGGHCEYASILTRGLRELGSEVEFFYITPAKREDTEKRWLSKQEFLKSNGGKDSKGALYTWSESLGSFYHAERGFVRQKWNYGTKELTRELKNTLDTFDVVIWQDIGGFKTKENDNTHWPELLDRRPGQKQIVMLHDHGALLRYPWLYMIQDKFDVMICVHPASYNMGSMFDLPRCMIFNPQVLPTEYKSSYDNREKQTTLGIGAWKNSKKLHEIVIATPWMRSDIKINLCGDGLERRYMITTDKCKPEYIRTLETDPDVSPSDLTGDKIQDRFWVAASKHPGFKYWNVVDDKTRDQIYKETFMFIDPAWYRVNENIDAHFSRVLMEALKNGIAPFARDLGLGTGGGNGSMFQAGKHYVNIPWDATPKQFATIVNNTMEKISRDEYDTILFNNRKILEQTDYRHVAQQIIDVCCGTDTPGVYGKWEYGSSNPKLIEAAEKQWYGECKRGFTFHRTWIFE